MYSRLLVIYVDLHKGKSNLFVPLKITHVESRSSPIWSSTKFISSIIKCLTSNPKVPFLYHEVSTSNFKYPKVLIIFTLLTKSTLPTLKCHLASSSTRKSSPYLTCLCCLQCPFCPPFPCCHYVH